MREREREKGEKRGEGGEGRERRGRGERQEKSVSTLRDSMLKESREMVRVRKKE